MAEFTQVVSDRLEFGRRECDSGTGTFISSCHIAFIWSKSTEWGSFPDTSRAGVGRAPPGHGEAHGGAFVMLLVPVEGRGLVVSQEKKV